MNDATYNELALERACKSEFGLDIEIKQILASHAPINRTDYATVFLTTKKQLYVYIDAQSRLVLGDVKKIMSRMGLVAELYLPPKGRPRYFDKIGRKKFNEVFPGRTHVTDQDLVFYRTLAPYAPALVQIAEVKNGIIYQYDSDSATGWRPNVKFAYRRIRTS
jgi:hypothetical protein